MTYMLLQRGLGVWVYGRLVPLLMYAGDIVLLADGAADLAASMAAVHEDLLSGAVGGLVTWP